MSTLRIARPAIALLTGAAVAAQLLTGIPAEAADTAPVNVTVNTRAGLAAVSDTAVGTNHAIWDTNLVKLDLTLLEAAADLGARPFKTFLTITLPLSKPGILAGSMLVFIPAVGEFVIPELLGPSNSLMIGKVLWQVFFTKRDWPAACAVAIALLLLLLIPIVMLQRAQAAEARGAHR